MVANSDLNWLINEYFKQRVALFSFQHNERKLNYYNNILYYGNMRLKVSYWTFCYVSLDSMYSLNAVLPLYDPQLEKCSVILLLIHKSIVCKKLCWNT